MSSISENLIVGEAVSATFSPKNLTSMKKSATPFIGKVGVFEVLWEIEDGDFQGQFAMRVPNDWGAEDFFWVPSGDLIVIGD